MDSNLKNLENIWKKMEKDGFDVSKPLKWGFFFFDTDKNKLLKVFDELIDYEYTKECIEKVDSDEWKLYVTKVEILSMDKLYRRNIAFNELAEHCDIDLYDGWDVQKV